MLENPLAIAQHNLIQGLSRGGYENPEEPETIQAMQITLEIPKTPPQRNNVLAAAGAAVVALCLDERAATPGYYQESLAQWYGHRIRKVARRARNSAWDKVQQRAGITKENNGARARAFFPSAVGKVPAEIKKLQISGTDLPYSEAETPNLKYPQVYVDASLHMTAGKAAAQVGHATMLLATHLSLEELMQWQAYDYRIQVHEISKSEFQRHLNQPNTTKVQDAGFTEVAPGSITTCARWPYQNA